MPIKWDTQADAKLLVGIVATSSSAIDYQAIAQYMGEGVTVNAVRLHIRTLKERAGATDPLPKATPKSSAEGTRKRASPTKPRATKSNRVTKEKTGKSKAVKTEKAEPTPTPTPQADGNESQEETDLPGFEGTATMGIKTEVEQALEDAELHEC